jgi:beta-lactamase class A
MSPFALLATAALLQSPADTLRDAILHRIARDSGATVAVVLRDPVQGFFVAVHPDLRFHAASTMKIPVLLELGRRVDARELRWTDSIPVHNRFASIVDGSAFSLDRNADGDTTVYAAIGGQLPLRRLATRMIVRSSNLATNLLIERLGAPAVTGKIVVLG